MAKTSESGGKGERVAIRIRPQLKCQLENYAAALHTSLSQLILDAVIEQLDSIRQRAERAQKDLEINGK